MTRYKVIKRNIGHPAKHLKGTFGDLVQDESTGIYALEVGGAIINVPQDWAAAADVAWTAARAELEAAMETEAAVAKLEAARPAWETAMAKLEASMAKLEASVAKSEAAKATYRSLDLAKGHEGGAA